MELIIENVRSFKDKHIIPIRPLTIMVGENSTGKTTFLSMLAAVCSDKFPSNNFNRPPYDLGTFDTIVSQNGPKERSTNFMVGFSTKVKGGVHRLEAWFEGSHGQPTLSKLDASHPKGSVYVEFTNEKVKGRFSVKGNKSLEDISFAGDNFTDKDSGASVSSLLPSILTGISEDLFRKTEGNFGKFFEMLNAVVARPDRKAISIAPVRTKPHRTYDELLDDFNPEGNHIPLILSRALAKETGNSKELLRESLDKFGCESGLFNKIEIKKLGRSAGDPFQIRVKTKGPSRNLTDVGYGVSQSLPVLVESLLCDSNSMLLLQQPEVHLHPRAQAALGSFLTDLVVTHEKNFVVETHSDFFMDRIRQEIANKKISPNDVLILFFDKQNTKTKVHKLELDTHGNIINAPKEYRAFFMNEELNLLLRGKI